MRLDPQLPGFSSYFCQIGLLGVKWLEKRGYLGVVGKPKRSKGRFGWATETWEKKEVWALKLPAKKRHNAPTILSCLTTWKSPTVSLLYNLEITHCEFAWQFAPF